ncbi:hypothetical protein DFS33DRAFT_1229835, partial [Desarmillaria ectypa]
GTGCTIVEITMKILTTHGAESSVNVSLIRRNNAFNIAAGFVYFNGRDGQGNYCNNPNFPEAFRNPYDHIVQVQCDANN